MAVKLRRPLEESAVDSGQSFVPQTIPLKPLAISGILISREVLVEALRIYVPTLVDVEVVEDGDRFLLTLRPERGVGRESSAVQGNSESA